MVDKTGDCWLWTGYTRGGYGRLTRGSRQYQAHRVAYETERGPIPAGMVLDHVCKNTRCVRPDHLEPVTQVANIQRGEWFPGVNTGKTHCPQGHPYSGDNLYVIPATGGRMCRTCKSAARRAEKARRREREALGLGPGKPGRPAKTST